MRAAVGFLIGAALGLGLAAAGLWLRVLPERERLEERVQAAELEADRARRTAGDAEQWAETERRRNRELEEELGRMRVLLAAGSSTPAPGHAGGADPAPAPENPAEWEIHRLGQEIELLALDPLRVRSHPRFPLVLEAVRARGPAARDRLVEILDPGFPDNLRITATELLHALADEAAVPALLRAWSAETDPLVKRATLEALAALPGDEQVAVLESVWATSEDPLMRRPAIEGLARRGHPEAIAIAAEGGPGSTRALRIKALRALFTRAAGGRFEDPALRQAFERALLTADGPPQQFVAMTALEGFWSKESLPALEELLGREGVNPELVTRARALGDALRAGAPRPAEPQAPEERE